MSAVLRWTWPIEAREEIGLAGTSRGIIFRKWTGTLSVLPEIEEPGARSAGQAQLGQVLQSLEKLDVSRWIPDSFQSAIADTHSEGRRLIEGYGVPDSTIELLQVAELVEGAWARKPERPRFVFKCVIWEAEQY